MLFFVGLGFHMMWIRWRLGFRVRGNNDSPKSFVIFRPQLKARLLLPWTWFRKPGLNLWACERGLHLHFCSAVLNFSYWNGEKDRKNLKCSLSAEKQVLRNIWFCGRQSLNNNPDFKIDICFWQEVQKLHSSVSKLLVTLVLAMTFKGFEGLSKLCQDPKKEKKNI